MIERFDVLRIEAGTVRGVGFRVASDLLLTALHVVGRIEEGKLVLHGDVAICRAVTADKKLVFPVCYVEASDVRYDAELDWACLRVGATDLDGVRVFAIDDGTQLAGQDPWATYGFPDNSPSDGRALNGTIASAGSVVRLGSSRQKLIQLFSLQAGAGRGGVVRGYSGAPVVVGGNAVALISLAAEGEDGRSEEGTLYSVPLAAIAPALDLPVQPRRRGAAVADASVREAVTRRLVSWGGRHVFGNVPREQWSDEAIPFLPLEKLYVEPDGSLVSDGENQRREPLLALIERLTSVNAEPSVVIVAADFGSGKSLSARTLACHWAERRFTSAEVPLDVPLPIHVRCADDFASDTIEPELTIRRAWKRQAGEIAHFVAVDDESFAWPSREQRVVCLLDGLDEVALSDQHLHSLFQKMADKSTRNHRFVVFSRPGILPPTANFAGNVVVVVVQPFSSDQIGEWLARWNSLHPNEPPITREALAQRQVTEIARTPILLFMVAFTWAQATSNPWPPTLAEIYEHFLYQIASGKAGADSDRHRPIAKASQKLLGTLRSAGVLDTYAQPQDAMLWLMGRVAWEAHILEQRRSLEAPTREHLGDLLRGNEEALTREYLGRLLRRNEEVALPENIVEEILDGLVLTLQIDLQNANHTILFGHKSFREFLVGRHWAMALRRIVRDRDDSARKVTAWLLGGRLLGHDDESFEYLMQLINASAGAQRRPASPLGWSDDQRTMLLDWAQGIFSDQHLEFGQNAATLINDRRAELREAALAIGSTTKGSSGMRANEPLMLRSMLAWFWLNGGTAIVVAPGAEFAKASLSGTILRGANLSGANLNAANLSRATLVEAKLSRADARGANVDGADFSLASLIEADLRGVHAHEADFSGADLSGINLCEADLTGSNLCMAHLNGPTFAGLTSASSTSMAPTFARLFFVGLSSATPASMVPTSAEPTSAGPCLGLVEVTLEALSSVARNRSPRIGLSRAALRVITVASSTRITMRPRYGQTASIWPLSPPMARPASVDAFAAEVASSTR